MGKRSDFERIPRDFYPTPLDAVGPLIPHLAPGARFAEPCAGDGRLIRHLEAYGMVCTFACDVEPRAPGVVQGDATRIVGMGNTDLFVTNPPWDRDVLHPIIDVLAAILPTWLLFDADWMHTRQAATYLRQCHRIVSVGRVRWIEGSDNDGKDNACWCLFGPDAPVEPRFVGRW